MLILRERSDPKEEVVLKFVAFQVGSQNFAVEIHQVKEILPNCKVIPLSKAPSFLEGVMDLWGRLIPVLDLRKRLDLQDIRQDAHTRIIVLRARKKSLGLIVDSVHRVLTVPPENILAPPSVSGSASSSDLVLAVVKHEEQLYMILDLDRILTAEERMSLEETKL